MKRKLCLAVAAMLGVLIGYIGTNLIGETNVIQNLGVFSDGPDSGAPLFAGLVIFPLLSLIGGYVVWRSISSCFQVTSRNQSTKLQRH